MAKTTKTKHSFLLSGGQHVEDGKTYRHGDVIESIHPLDKLFRGKFQRVRVGATTLQRMDDVEPEEVADVPIGDDVTELFDEATAWGFKVFRDARKFFLYVDGELQNADGLTKAKMTAYISEVADAPE